MPLRLRPRFRVATSLSPDDVLRRIGQALRAPGAPCHGSVSDAHVEIMADVTHHFWSPELRARVEPTSSGALVRGRFGPKPAVWTMFMVIYLHLGFIAIGAAMYAAALATLDRAPWPLWLVPASLLAAALVYVAGRIGQRLGAEEMDRIARFVEDVVRSD